MTNLQRIQRGTIVEVTDWNYAPLQDNRWVVEQRYTKNKTKLARISKLKKEKIVSLNQSFSWTVVDLKKIGKKRMPKLDIELPISECRLYMHFDMIIERDGDDVYFLWGAHSQNTWNSTGYHPIDVRFKQVDTPYSRTRTTTSCINNWKRFAKRNDIQNYEIFPFGHHEDRLAMAKLKWCSELYKDQFHSAMNARNTILSRTVYSGGIFGGDELTKQQRAKVIRQMKKSGEWKKLQRLKAMFEDFRLIGTFDDLKEIKAYGKDVPDYYEDAIKENKKRLRVK